MKNKESQLINHSTNQLINSVLTLADSSLILGHRNSEWCGHGPVLEQDIAITNISLDLIGQARSFYQLAAEEMNKEGGEATEDSLAYLRDANEFRNFILLELPKGDWAYTILRQFFFSSWQYILFEQLQQSTDTSLAAVAEKSLKETTYHRRWSSEWVIRLGDGTEESKRRMEKALNECWGYAGEFFQSNRSDAELIDLSLLKEPWLNYIRTIFDEAGLSVPSIESINGQSFEAHTPHLAELLNEMQVLPRTYPDATW